MSRESVCIEACVALGYGLAVQEGSPIRESLNAAVLQLQETGVLATLKHKWWSVKNGGGMCNARRN